MTTRNEPGWRQSEIGSVRHIFEIFPAYREVMAASANRRQGCFIRSGFENAEGEFCGAAGILFFRTSRFHGPL